MSIAVEDFSKCCRLCLSFIGKMAPLFGASLDSMLTAIVNLNFSQDDGYPQQVCARCIVKISGAHNFKMVVLKSHNELTEALLKIGHKTNDEENILIPIAEQQKLELKRSNSKKAIASTMSAKNNLLYQFGTVVPKNRPYKQSLQSMNNPDGDNNSDQTDQDIIDDVNDESVSQVTFDNIDCDFQNNVTYDDFNDDLESHVTNNDINDDMENHVTNENSLETESYVTNLVSEVISECESIKPMELVDSWRTGLYDDDTLSAISGSVAGVSRVSGLEVSVLNDDEKDELPKKCCRNVYSRIDDWKEHIQSHLPPTIECDKCKRLLNKEDRHNCSDVINKSNLCGVCGEMCANMEELIKHMKAHNRHATLNKSKNRSHLCPYCGKNFKWDTSLHRHLRYHTGNNLYKCDLCTKSFSTRSYMKTHEASHDDIKRYECNICEARFKQKSSVKQHIQTVHDKSKARIRHRCNECSSTFLCKETLVKHVRTHHSVRPFKCRFCDKSFGLEFGRRTHEKIHIKQQQRVFIEEDFMPRETDHDYGVSKIRTIRVEFMCFNCEVKFKKKEELQDHVKTCKPVARPVDDTIMKCKMCNHEFTECDVLLEHYNNIHKVLAVIDESNGKKNITVFAEQLLIKDVHAPEPKKKFYIRTKVK